MHPRHMSTEELLHYVDTEDATTDVERLLAQRLRVVLSQIKPTPHSKQGELFDDPDRPRRT